MSKTIEQIEKELDAKIPRDVISERESGGKRKLSYLEGWYVIDRLNKVLGPGNWSYSSEATHVHTGVVQTKSGEAHSVHYIARVRLVLSIGERTAEFADYGYGDGTDIKIVGKAHELAIKEAVTDGLKRCAKNLGMSMGLALYDKTQENVDDGEQEEQKAKPPVVERDAKESPKESPKPTPTTDTTKTRTLIRSYVNAAIKKGVLSMSDMKSHLQSKYQADTLDSIKDDSLNEILEYVKALTK